VDWDYSENDREDALVLKYLGRRSVLPRRPSPAEGATRRKVLGFVKEFVADAGYPPTYREIAVGVGLASTSSVAQHLRTLERQGDIVRGARKPRALKVQHGR
jgi:SOS-response transcriptional repressor LexA